MDFNPALDHEKFPCLSSVPGFVFHVAGNFIDILFNKNAFFSDLCDSHNMRRTHSKFCTHMQICHKVVGEMRADTIFQLYACFKLPILPKKPWSVKFIQITARNTQTRLLLSHVNDFRLVL